jgi:HlyD family secretion protein
MARKKLIVLSIVAAAVVILVLVNIRLSYEPSVDVETSDIEVGTIVERVSGPGVIFAESAVKISSSVMGRITRLMVKEGDGVDKGDVLLEIDSSQYKARLQQAEAYHRAALARENLAGARLEDAHGQLDRKKALFTSNLISERDVESATTAFQISQAELEAAQETAREAAASLRAAQDDLTKTVIVSPISGAVTSLNAEQGEIVITGTMNNPGTVIMTVSNLDTMEVKAEIDETDVAKITPGDQADISVDAFPDTVLQGRVSVVGSSSSSAGLLAARADQRSTFLVRIRVEDSLSGLRPGMTTTVDIVTATKDSVPFTPLQALVLREAGDGEDKKEREGIFIVEQGRSKFLPVKTGISDDKNIELVGDIAAGTQVITGPFKTLRDLEDDTRVRVIQERE